MVEAPAWQNRKLDTLSLGVLFLQLRRGWLNVGNPEMGIGVEDLKFCARVNDCAFSLRLNAENCEPQKGVHIHLGGIIGSGNDHAALRLDVFVAVIADLV